MLRELLLVLALVTAARAGAPPCFFIMGDGHLAIVNAHTDEHVTVRYRRQDGIYDPHALARLRRVFRSSGDAREQDVSLRLIEVLSHVQKMAGGHPLVLLSGYRSPTYNQSLKNQGKQVAGGSMHTEGLAADLAFPPAPAAPEALAPGARPRLLRHRLLREGGLPPHRPAAFLGGDDVAGG